METESPIHETPESATAESQSRLHQVTPFSKYLAMALFILLPFLGGWIGYNIALQEVAKSSYELNNTYPTQEEQTDTVENDAQDHRQPEFITSNTAHVQFKKGTFWQVVSDRDTDLPVFFDEPHVLLENAEYGCRLAVTDFDYSSDMYTDTSFGERIKNDYFRFDSRWYAVTEDVSSIEFSDERQYHNNEFRVAANHRVPEFVLWHIGGEPVPHTCNVAMNVLLERMEYYFPEIDLGTNTEGQVSIYRKWDQMQGPDESIVSFSDDGRALYSVMETPPGFGHGNRIFAWENTLISATEAVYQVDPFAKTVLKLIDVADLNQVIFDIYLHDDTFYYLVADEELLQCKDKGSSRCRAQLLAYDLRSGTSREIANGFAATRILGYSPDKDIFYVSYGYGDAGCVTATVTSLVGRVPSESNQIGGCSYDEGDAGYQEYKQVMNEIDAQVVTHTTAAAAALVDGQLRSPSTTTIDSYTVFVFPTTGAVSTAEN